MAPLPRTLFIHGRVKMSWLKNIFGKPQGKASVATISEFNNRMAEIKNSGSVDDGHYTDSIDKIKQLKKEGKNREAIKLLLRCVDATEKESVKANSKPIHNEKFAFLSEGRSNNSWGVAPWYYEQLAILYRKEKEYQKEVGILERYEKQPKAPGAGPEKLAGRLIKARALRDKNA